METRPLIKQTNPAFSAPPYDAIITDGCFWRSLLYAPEWFLQGMFTTDELQRAFHYSVPDYMEDHRNPGEDRCFIVWHKEIIRIGFYIFGIRNIEIEYKYRKDLSNMITGTEEDLSACNFFISKCRLSSGGSHFFVSDIASKELWNPHTVHSDDIISLRGFYINIL